MTTLMIFISIAMMGFACSFGCGTITTPFILGSLLGEGQDIKSSRNTIAIFSLGKIFSLGLMGLFSSLFGSAVLGMIEEMYPNSTIWIIRIITLFFGIWLIYTAIKKNPCADCNSCSSNISSINKLSEKSINIKKRKNYMYFFIGSLYSTIPCAPLVSTLGYASTMPPFLAVLLLVVFGIVNSIVPVLGLASIVGLANTEFKRDLPNYLKYIKLSGGIIIILAGLFRV